MTVLSQLPEDMKETAASDRWCNIFLCKQCEE